VLACPACGALLYADKLRELAASADAAAGAGELLTAREHWNAALDLLPSDSQQHAAIRTRVGELTRRIDEGAGDREPSAGEAPSPDKKWWLRGAAGVGAVAVLLRSKLKFLLLGLTKISTVTSMFAFFGVYWSIYGWPLALGLVGSIYIHEMGHVAMLRRLGIAAGAPLFIPGVGAFVMLKQHVTDPLIDAKIGLAGPIWGLGAAVGAFAIHAMTGTAIWLAIAQLTGFINLFNLIPIWQLDGSRGVHVLTREERWLLVSAIAITYLLTEQRMLFLVGGVMVWRALQREAGPGSSAMAYTFIGLVVALSLLARGVG
jgi:Zn-dependent protease